MRYDEYNNASTPTEGSLLLDGSTSTAPGMMHASKCFEALLR
jgi:hypothetical protein